MNRLGLGLLASFLLVMSCAQTVKVSDFGDQLRAMNADSDFAVWIDQNQIKSPVDAWTKLQRPDWMLWLIKQYGLSAKLDKTKIRLFVSDCAEGGLDDFNNEYPDEKGLTFALKVARRYANGEASENEFNKAAKKVARIIANAYARADSEDVRAQSVRTDADAYQAQAKADADTTDEAADNRNSANAAFMADNASYAISNANAAYDQAQNNAEASANEYSDANSRANAAEERAQKAHAAVIAAIRVAEALAIDRAPDPAIKAIDALDNDNDGDDGDAQTWLANMLRFYFLNPFDKSTSHPTP